MAAGGQYASFFGKRRKDVKIEEGQVVQEKHDVKGDIVGGAIGTGGGTLIGVAFSNVAGKGKDLDLPAQTGMLVRMDSTITVPVTGATSAAVTSGTP